MPVRWKIHNAAPSKSDFNMQSQIQNHVIFCHYLLLKHSENNRSMKRNKNEKGKKMALVTYHLWIAKESLTYFT